MRWMGRGTGIGESADLADSMHWDSADCGFLRQVGLQMLKFEIYPNQPIYWVVGSGAFTQGGQYKSHSRGGIHES